MTPSSSAHRRVGRAGLALTLGWGWTVDGMGGWGEVMLYSGGADLSSFFS